MNGGDVILADEPTGALDSKSGKEMMEVLHELHASGHTIILVTHDIDEAIKLSDRIEVMKDGLFVASFQVDNRLDEHSQRILKEHIQNAL